MVSQFIYAAAVSGGGVEHLASKADETAWAGGLTPAADGATEEDLLFRVFEVESEEDRAENILFKARTGAGPYDVQRGIRGSEGCCQDARL